MRIAFSKTLLACARRDPRIILVTNDLGYSVFEPFVRACPNQFINAGVAEQNMTGIAAGLALEGKRPIMYSIIPFVTMRNFEQVRNDICLQNLNVKIVGVGSGFAYGIYGYTHLGIEDLALMRVLPGLTILSPSDPIQASQTLIAALHHEGPVYIRLNKVGEPIFSKEKKSFTIGKGIIHKKGNDCAIISTGSILSEVLRAETLLKKDGVRVSIVDMPTVKPIDRLLLEDIRKKVRVIFSVEEHSQIGGLGSAIAHELEEFNRPIPFKRIGIEPDFNATIIGSQKYLREFNKLTAKYIRQTVLDTLAKYKKNYVA